MADVVPETDNSEGKAEAHDVSALSHQPFPNAPPRLLIRFVLGLRRFLQRLADRVVPADAAVCEYSMGVGFTAVLGALTRLGIADILAESPMNARQLAEATGCNADAIHRAMRAAVTSGFFSLSKSGVFSNNRMSIALRKERLSRTREFVEYISSKSNCAAYLEMDHILKTGEDGFMLANKADLWEWFDTHPRERENFAQAMMGVTIGETPMVARLYPFGDIKRLCDLGGGRGALLSEIVIRYPHIEGVLFDCEGVIESARPLLKARGVEDRIELVVGNFFESVVPGCDAYLLKNVLHDWDDQRCEVILSNCRKVMQPGYKILLVEIILERNDTTNFASYRDIHVMTVCTGGRERSPEDYARLLGKADFTMTRVFRSPIISVIEGQAN